MAEPNAFMAERDRRVAANRKQLAAIGILNAVEGMREAQEAIRAEARRYRSPPRPRPLRGPSRSSGPPRRSGRVAKQPPKRYYDDMALSWPGATPRKRRHVGKSRSSRRGPSDRYAHYGDSYATSQAEDAAEAAATSFAEKCKNLCSVKVMTPSQVSGGFWMNLPYQFYREVGVYTKCTSEFRCGDDECDWEVVWLPHGGGGGLSGQWREFSIRQGLRTGDSVAFEFQGLNKWSAPVLKAHIFRAGDYGDLLQKENRVENHDTEDDQPKASKGEIAEEEELAVAEILDRQFTANATALYLVSWAGYEPEENTWEPLSSFSAGLETYKMSDKLRAELGLVGGKGTARRSSKRCNK